MIRDILISKKSVIAIALVAIYLALLPVLLSFVPVDIISHVSVHINIFLGILLFSFIVSLLFGYQRISTQLQYQVRIQRETLESVELLRLHQLRYQHQLYQVSQQLQQITHISLCSLAYLLQVKLDTEQNTERLLKLEQIIKEMTIMPAEVPAEAIHEDDNDSGEPIPQQDGIDIPAEEQEDIEQEQVEPQQFPLIIAHKLAEYQLLLTLHQARIDRVATKKHKKISLKGKLLTRTWIERCLKIQLLTKDRWIKFQHIRLALNISKKNTVLGKLLNKLVPKKVLQRSESAPTSPRQKYKLIKPFIRLKP